MAVPGCLSLQEYISRIKLDEKYKFEGRINTIVQNAANTQIPDLTGEETSNLYKYRVPKLGPEGTCSLTEELEEEPFKFS